MNKDLDSLTSMIEHIVEEGVRISEKSGYPFFEGNHVYIPKSLLKKARCICTIVKSTNFWMDDKVHVTKEDERAFLAEYEIYPQKIATEKLARWFNTRDVSNKEW
jgi:hypothetical protein